MNIEILFNEIIEKLNRDERPLIKLSEDDHNFLREKWRQIIEAKNYNELVKIMCLLDNTFSLSTIHQQNILETLSHCDNDEITILCLGVARKHIIEANHKNSNRVDIDTLDIFKKLLTHKNPEVKEWTLRNIESLGAQSLYLKNDVLSAKPSFLKLLNENHRACAQIIELLEKRWSYQK